MKLSGQKLQEVIIKREKMPKHDRWTVSRKRATHGESAIFNNLEQCFDFVRALYDKDGNQLEMF